MKVNSREHLFERIEAIDPSFISEITMKDVMSDDKMRDLVKRFEKYAPEEKTRLVNILLRKGYDAAMGAYAGYDPEIRKQRELERREQAKRNSAEARKNVISLNRDILLKKRTIDELVNQVVFTQDVRMIIKRYSAPQPTTTNATYKPQISKSSISENYSIKDEISILDELKPNSQELINILINDPKILAVLIEKEQSGGSLRLGKTQALGLAKISKAFERVHSDYTIDDILDDLSNIKKTGQFERRFKKNLGGELYSDYQGDMEMQRYMNNELTATLYFGVNIQAWSRRQLLGYDAGRYYIHTGFKIFWDYDTHRNDFINVFTDNSHNIGQSEDPNFIREGLYNALKEDLIQLKSEIITQSGK